MFVDTYSQSKMAYSTTSLRLTVVIILCSLLFSCSSSDVLNCLSDSNVRWNISISTQEELNRFVDNVTSSIDEGADRCIQLFFTGKSFELDLINIMGIKLGTRGGLVMVGVASSRVTINCVANATALEELRSIFQPIANVSLVVLDGLVFARCPVPVVIEEVSTVVIQNCDFM